LLLSISPPLPPCLNPQKYLDMLQTLISCIVKPTPKIVAYRAGHKLSTLWEHTNSLSSQF
jgi:hypothetical protein